ncbi:hypothetical protein ABL849_31000 [Variovorax sp. 375MFSha3.1]|uniref:hypothetical protein n=1 Tax=unclassified Variovorax TaxID=663243 RepID=UPI003AAB283D
MQHPEVVAVDFDQAGGNFRAPRARTGIRCCSAASARGCNSFYAIDMTDPAAMTDETIVASDGLISDPTDGTADAIYVGGPQWPALALRRVRGRGHDHADPAPTKIAPFTDGATAPRAQLIIS